MPKPVIDSRKCTRCGTCVDMCPAQVFARDGERIIIKRPEKCIGCKNCEAQCPATAIKVEG